MRRIAAMLVVLAAVGTACRAKVETDPITGNKDVDVQAMGKRGEDWTSKLNGMGSYGMASGTGKAQQLGGEFTVSVALNGLTSGRTHPWHVHEGKCGSGGAIIGPASAYPAIRVGSEGRGEANARISAHLNEAKDYYINVHASSSDMGTIVACGDLDD